MKKRVLVVEDDDAVWSTFKDILGYAMFNHDSYELVREINGDNAIKLLREGNYDALLLDLMIPGLSGQQMLPLLDKDSKFKGFPVLINSAVGHMENMQAIFKSCKNLRIEVVPRPFDVLELAEVLRKLLKLPTYPISLARQSEAKGRTNMKHVLVVDDDPTVLDLYVPYFASKGYQVSAAPNGENALKILAKDKIDLLILDLAMPGIQGEDVMEKMKDNPALKEIPIIVDSAQGPSTGRPQKLKERFQGKLHFEFFQRPTSLERLEEIMSEIIVL